MDPKIKQLVCDSCWQTVFATESFLAAWEARLSTDLSTTGPGFSYTTPSWRQMQDSINYMCEWCDLVAEEVEFYYQHKKKTKDPPSPDETFNVLVRFMISAKSLLELQLVIEKSWTPRYLVYANEDDNASPFISAREVLPKVDALETYELARHCIDDCLHHGHCPLPKDELLPTRVIDCDGPNGPRLLIHDGTHKARYVALSYVWGERQPHSTTSEKLKEYTKCIETRKIPKTISDAIKVTRSLGQRYLWVDAFCIIQDDKTDKQIEIPRMQSIFGNAFFTIVAASSTKVSDGFLQDRRLSHTPRILPFICPSGGTGTMFVGDPGTVGSQPVNERAWCLEERVLSTRTITFTSHTVQYGCRSIQKNINNSPRFMSADDGFPRLPDCMFTSTAPASIYAKGTDEEMRYAWRNILELYTRRSLTKPRDRLLAIAGVAKQFHLFWQTDTYIAGLWAYELPRCLLWRKNMSDRYPRPSKYRGPSWSWAAVDGEIEGQIQLIHSKRDWICAVIRCEATLVQQESLYGNVECGIIVLDTIVRKVLWDPEECEVFEVSGIKGQAMEGQSDKGEIGIAVADAIEPASETICEVFVALVEDTGRTLRGILLVLDDPSTGTYRRVGDFTGPYLNKSMWLGTPRQRITIV